MPFYTTAFRILEEAKQTIFISTKNSGINWLFYHSVSNRDQSLCCRQLEFGNSRAQLK